MEVLLATTTMASDGEETIDDIMAYVYFYLTGIVSALSIVGCVIIIVFYYKNPKLRTTGRKLLVFLSVADLLTAVGNLLGITWSNVKDDLGETSSEIFCEFHAALTFFSSISSFMWTVAIGAHLFYSIVRLDAFFADKMVPGFHVVCWSIPAVIAIVAWSLDVIGYDKNLDQPSWCWIDPETTVVNALFWQYMTGKAWEMASYVITVVQYTVVQWKIRRQIKLRKKKIHPTGGVKMDHNTRKMARASIKLTFVPAVFLAVRIWGTLRFILESHFGIQVIWIVPLQGIGDSAQGFANCILFLTLTDDVRRLLAKKCCCDCCCECCANRCFNGRSNQDSTSAAHPMYPTIKATVAPTHGRENTTPVPSITPEDIS